MLFHVEEKTLRRLMIALLVAGISAVGYGAAPRTLAFNEVAAQHIPVCGPTPVGFARCHSILVVPSSSPNAATPSGYGPSDLR
jgi:hypothetical protein